MVPGIEKSYSMLRVQLLTNEKAARWIRQTNTTETLLALIDMHGMLVGVCRKCTPKATQPGRYMRVLHKMFCKR